MVNAKSMSRHVINLIMGPTPKLIDFSSRCYGLSIRAVQENLLRGHCRKKSWRIQWEVNKCGHKKNYLTGDTVVIKKRKRGDIVRTIDLDVVIFS